MLPTPLPFVAQAPAPLRPWVGRRLAAWFARHARPLPWRRSAEAYPIWISEVMLQQTQVAAVVPYFERFLARFPDLASLARADEHEVLLLWEGLGYYRRARDLHRAARILMAEHGGVFPADPDAVRRLPGFGRYTANAVLSQAFDQRMPILEANSRRVLCRLLGVRADPRQGAVDKALWQAAEILLPQRQVGVFNQALMELGALVCRPDQPECGRCPLRERCHSHEHGLVDVIPARAERPAVTLVEEIAVVVHRGRRVLLVQRPADGRWGNMWEFPRVALDEGETHPVAATRLLESIGLRADLCDRFLTIRHSVTRFRITLNCLRALHQGGRFRPGVYVRGEWLRPEACEQYPVSMPQRRLARALAKREGGAGADVVT